MESIIKINGLKSVRTHQPALLQNSCPKNLLKPMKYVNKSSKRSQSLYLLEAVSEKSQLFYSRQHNANALYFIAPGGHLRIPGWRVVSSGSISFRILTKSSNALLIYASSLELLDIMGRRVHNDMSMDVADGQTGISISAEGIDGDFGGGQRGIGSGDLFALELREGRLVCLMDAGGGLIQTVAMETTGSRTTGGLSDGKEHLVRIEISLGDEILTNTKNTKPDIKHVINSADANFTRAERIGTTRVKGTGAMVKIWIDGKEIATQQRRSISRSGSARNAEEAT
ncbi:unnamed protein product [Protopolystoma xenopodis]|uniref:Laminin G domain-containing protein n=1 Tax=Protopolystoma xenopodis TaxID=117903 RepID=A0A3S5ALU2_9PLAT|nr:unnamed protein product [Protopolystoma xenopodis]